MAGMETLLIRAKGAARRGDAETARRLYRSVLDRHPANRRACDGLRALGDGSTPAQLRFDAMVEAFEAGLMEQAVRLGQGLAAEFPHVPGVLSMLGAALLQVGRHAEAETALRQALAVRPGDNACSNNLAIALRRQGREDEAEALYRSLIASSPAHPQARYNLAAMLDDKGRLDEAEALYRAAIAIAPDYFDAHYNLGNLCARRGLHCEAETCLRSAIELQPGHGDAHNNLGGALLKQNKPLDALAEFRLAAALAPKSRETLANAAINAGKALVLLGDRPGAVASFRSVLKRDPGNASARLQALFEEAQMCDWHARAEYALTAGPQASGIQPFAALPFLDDPAHQLQRSLACAAEMRAPFGSSASLPSPAPAHDGRIRIGYFSADFHDHATMHLMSGLFREHDRARFEVRLYSYGPPREEDACRIALRSQVDAFIDVSAMGDAQVIERARADNLDIAVDLKGYTHDTRCNLFAARLAPVQVAHMGYPGTSGQPTIDYFVADAIAAPPGTDLFFTEKLVRLPHCYQANDNLRHIEPDHAGRAAHGLPEEGFVFACFNHNYKISPREWDIWMRLLGRVEGSVLWLLRSNEWAEANLIREAAARGIGAERLVFAPSLPQAQHLGRLTLADLFLDTFAVNAHTTASDALWAGLPVLTLSGHQFAARVAASIVTAAGLPEMVASHEADYEATALALARNTGKLRTIRQKLADTRKTCPLFDTQTYTRDLERAFTSMHERHLAGQPPQAFAVG